MIISNYDWCNNLISEKLNKEYPRDFSICDGDGMIRKCYKTGSLGNEWATRFIIYESKFMSEFISRSQFLTLTALSGAMDWSKFDYMSGMFLLRHSEPVENIDVYVLNKTGMPFIKTITFEEFYNWISAKDKTLGKI